MNASNVVVNFTKFYLGTCPFSNWARSFGRETHCTCIVTVVPF